MNGHHLLSQVKTNHPEVVMSWVDAGFKTTAVEHGASLGIDVQVVSKDPAIKGFSIVKRRWVIERTLGWIMQHRRLARDYEALPDNSASMIRIAMIDNLTRRATAETTPTWRDTQTRISHKQRESDALSGHGRPPPNFDEPRKGGPYRDPGGERSALSVVDNTDFRFGGYGSSCTGYGELEVTNNLARIVVTNSSFTSSMYSQIL